VDDFHERGGLDVLERHFKFLECEHGIREKTRRLVSDMRGMEGRGCM